MTNASAEKGSCVRGWLVLAAACLVMFTPVYAQMQMSPISASLMEMYNVDEAQYMSVFTAPQLTAVFLSFAAGILLDKFGTKRMVLVGFALSTFGMVTRIFVTGYVPFYFATFMIGCSSSFLMTGGAKIVGRFFPVDKMGLPMGILYSCAGLASIVAFSTTALFESAAQAFVVAAALAGITILVWLFVVPSEKGGPEAANPEEAQNASVGEMLKSVLSCKELYFIVVAFTGIGILNFTINGMLPMALQSRGMSTETAGLMTSVSSIGGLIGSVILPVITSKVKSEKGFLCITSGLLIVLFPLVMIAPVGIALGAVLALIGFIVFGYTPVFLGLPVRYGKIGLARAGIAGGLLTMLNSLGAAAIPSLVLVPLSGGNFTTLFMILAAISAIVFVCIVLLKIPSMHKGEQAD